MSERTARVYMRLAKNRKVIEAVDAADMSINAAVRLLAAPKDDVEEVEDALEEAAAAINVLVAQAKIDLENLKKCLAEVRATFDSEEEFQMWLRQEFPEPTDPEEKEIAERLAEVVREMVQNRE
jgi:hypothetical protein